MKKPKSLNKNYMRSICQLEGWDWKGLPTAVTN